MGHPDGAHTHGASGALGAPIAAGAGVLIAAAVLPVLLAILHALLIAAAVILGLAVTAAAALAVWRIRRFQMGTARQPPWQPGALAASQPPALAPREVHLHLHGLTAAELAAVLGHAADPAGCTDRLPNTRP